MPESAAVLPPARFADRLNAFALDASLFSGGGVLSAMAFVMARGGAAPGLGATAAWTGLWLAAFVLYHAYYGSDGRRTFGKRALGLAVETVDGEAPDFSTALLRACAYLPSSLFCNLGFLWALRRDGRAWHDLIAGTRVVEAERRAGPLRLASSVGAWLLGTAAAAVWFGVVAAGPGMIRMRRLADARVALKSLAYLEERHKLSTGAYTADAAELLGFSDEARQVARALPYNLHADSIRLTADAASYAIEAEALDERRTALRLEGPVPLNPGAR